VYDFVIVTTNVMDCIDWVRHTVDGRMSCCHIVQMKQYYVKESWVKCRADREKADSNERPITMKTNA